MLKSVDFQDFGKFDAVPQAIISKPVSFFESKGFRFVHGADALDEFEGAAFWLDDLPFALMHYPGYPDESTTIYLSRENFGRQDVEKITVTIRSILTALGLSPESLMWERKNDPDL